MPLPALICLNNKLAVKAKEGAAELSSGRGGVRANMPRQEHIARHTCSQGTATRRVRKTMSTYRVKNLLSPHSVALVGARPPHGSGGGAVLHNSREAQFQDAFGRV